jgi:hypothetical protein
MTGNIRNESVFEADTSIEAEAKEGVQQAKEVAKQAMDQVQQKAQEVAGQAQTQAKSALGTRKDQAVDQLGGVAEAFRATSNELRNQDKGAIAQYADKVADQVERVTTYLEDRDVDQLLADTETFARRQPELFLGGAFIAGLLVGRFIKSSSERRRARQEQEMAYNSYGYSEDYRPNPTNFNRPSADRFGTSYQSDVGDRFTNT